jgi:hypothetical protein
MTSTLAVSTHGGPIVGSWPPKSPQTMPMWERGPPAPHIGNVCGQLGGQLHTVGTPCVDLVQAVKVAVSQKARSQQGPLGPSKIFVNGHYHTTCAARDVLLVVDQFASLQIFLVGEPHPEQAELPVTGTDLAVQAIPHLTRVRELPVGGCSHIAFYGDVNSDMCPWGWIWFPVGVETEATGPHRTAAGEEYIYTGRGLALSWCLKLITGRGTAPSGGEFEEPTQSQTRTGGEVLVTGHCPVRAWSLRLPTVRDLLSDIGRETTKVGNQIQPYGNKPDFTD